MSKPTDDKAVKQNQVILIIVAAIGGVFGMFFFSCCMCSMCGMFSDSTDDSPRATTVETNNEAVQETNDVEVTINDNGVQVIKRPKHTVRVLHWSEIASLKRGTSKAEVISRLGRPLEEFTWPESQPDNNIREYWLYPVADRIPMQLGFTDDGKLDAFWRYNTNTGRGWFEYSETEYMRPTPKKDAER